MTCLKWLYEKDRINANVWVAVLPQILRSANCRKESFRKLQCQILPWNLQEVQAIGQSEKVSARIMLWAPKADFRIRGDNNRQNVFWFIHWKFLPIADKIDRVGILRLKKKFFSPFRKKKNLFSFFRILFLFYSELYEGDDAELPAKQIFWECLYKHLLFKGFPSNFET